MPACASDNFSRFIRSNSDLYGSINVKPNGGLCCSPRYGSSPLSPSSPLSTSPKSSPPMATLRRSMSSTFTLIPEELEEPERLETPNDENILFRLIVWFPLFVLGSGRKVLNKLFEPAWGQMLVVLPTLWISAWLWIFWKSIQCPLNMIKWCLMILTGRSSSSEKSTKRRTVLISSGSTIQALHLARNFYCAGARVIVVETDGHFGLAKFSTAVDKFYTIAKPCAQNPQNYIETLCHIVESEKVNYYVPVCATSSAYFDAVAKPHLEILGCSCFMPGLREVAILDDIAEVMHRCQEMTKPTPLYKTITSKDDVISWYDDATVPHEKKYFMASVGPLGIRERIKFIMPADKKDFRISHEISEDKPWVVVQDMQGEHFLTCTTIKNNQVVANVTCRIDPKTKGLTHEYNKEIEAWLKQFFVKLIVQKPITGHVSFRFVKDRATTLILPLGAKVGVSLPYICHTSAHPKLVWRPCPHINRQNSVKIENYWMHEAVSNTLKYPGFEAVTKLIGNVLDKREALFAYWDPLPYCAYYQMQLPFSSILGYIHNRDDRNLSPPTTRSNSLSHNGQVHTGKIFAPH